MKTLNYTRLNQCALNQSQMSRSALNAARTLAGHCGGAVVPDPGEQDTWLWDDSTPVLWGDDTSLLLEQPQTT